MVQPLDGLRHRESVEMPDEESVRDDADAEALVRELAQHAARARDHRHRAEEVALGHRKAVQAVVVLARDAPFREAVGNITGERLDRPLEPLRGDFADASVEVRADAVEVDAEHDLAAVRGHGGLQA